MLEDGTSFRKGRCGKICFDKKTASTKKNFLESLGREKMRIYQCGKCQSWYLTKRDRYKK